MLVALLKDKGGRPIHARKDRIMILLVKFLAALVASFINDNAQQLQDLALEWPALCKMFRM